MTPDEEQMLNRPQPADLDEAKVWIAQLRYQVETHREREADLTKPLYAKLEERGDDIVELQRELEEARWLLGRERKVVDRLLEKGRY